MRKNISMSNKENSDDLVFVGSFVKQSESIADQRFSQAGMLFQKKFIEFCEPNKTIALIPIFYNQKDDAVSEDIKLKTVYIGSKNKVTEILSISKIIRIIKDTYLTTRLLSKEKTKNIFFYNIDIHNFIICFLAKYILRKKVYVVVADYVVYSSKIFNWIYNFILKKIDGVIVLSPAVLCNTNSSMLLGLVRESQLKMCSITKLKKKVLLSGSLDETTGFSLALKYFSKRDDIELFITGKPLRYSKVEFEQLLEEYVIPSNNIHYLGLLEYSEYLEVLDKCDIALSLRNPNDSEHEYNFPSKILEYLAASKLVISTKKYSGISEGILYYSAFTLEGIDYAVEKILTESSLDLNARKKRTYDFLEDNFSKETLNTIISELTNGVLNENI